jgi:hypothetical protein
MHSNHQGEPRLDGINDMTVATVPSQRESGK